MTPAEVGRLIDSKNRLAKIEAKERASFDYIQASLIIKGVSICLGEKSSYPTLQEAYPSLFEDLIEEQAEKIQKQKETMSILRFRQFAQTYNNKYKEVQE